MEESPCTFYGMCVDLCPVGALLPKMSKGKGRTWETEKVKTICPYCGTGCSIFLHVKDDTVTGVSPCWESPVNRGENYALKAVSVGTSSIARNG